MALTRDEVLREMDEAWRELRQQLRGLDDRVDWKSDPQDPESWSVRDIVSHVLGTQEGNALAYLKHVGKRDGTEKRLEADDPVRTPERRAQSLAELVTELDAQCVEMRRMIEEATPAQLEARARFIGRSGGREQTFLERAYGSFHNHMRGHTEQVTELRRELGRAGPA